MTEVSVQSCQCRVYILTIIYYNVRICKEKIRDSRVSVISNTQIPIIIRTYVNYGRKQQLSVLFLKFSVYNPYYVTDINHNSFS